MSRSLLLIGLSMLGKSLEVDVFRLGCFAFLALVMRFGEDDSGNDCSTDVSSELFVLIGLKVPGSLAASFLDDAALRFDCCRLGGI